MKLLHVSDFHLGKWVNGFSMLEDQEYILAQILDIADAEQADGMVIAGDVYDKQVPPGEAVRLFDEFLTKLSRRGIPAFVISGNHDSAERLAFGARLLAASGVYVSPVYDGRVVRAELEDAHGTVGIYLLPFLKPALVRHVYGEEGTQSYQEALQTAVSHLEVDTSQRNVLVAHQFVTGASRCDSETVSVGGLDNVDVSVFEDFDYVALGHIHGPQRMGRETVRYCGTPLKYSFSEAEQEKSVTVVELGAKGDVCVRAVPLRPLRDMRRLRGSYMEVTAREFYAGKNTQDYLQITLTDEEEIPGAMEKLRVVYPNLMQLAYDNRRTRENRPLGGGGAREKKTEQELLAEFYEQQNNQPPSARQMELAARLLERIKEADAI